MQIERKIKILYRWWNETDTEIPIEHLGDLESHAEEYIFSMRKAGYVSGELSCNMGEVEYRGHWEVIS